jgi:hypothetical protein
MKLLNELLDLRESAEKNLLGLIINGKEITKDTPLNKWRGNFDCFNNKLTSLKYCPSEVGGNFLCYNNELTSLEYCPSEVGGSFDCYNNKLTSLEYCPSKVGGSFYCSDNKLTSLKDIHKQLTKMKGKFDASNNPIKSHVIGILLVEGCTWLLIDNKKVEAIINKYLPNTEGKAGFMKCKHELQDADFDEYAKL